MKVYLFILLLVISSCKSSQRSLPSDFLTLPGTSYFPIGHLDNQRSYIDTFLSVWYSNMLAGLNEPVIFNDSSNKEIFRFTWLRTFHHPISIRIERSNDKVVLYTKEADGAGGYQHGKIMIDQTKELSLADWNSFMNYVNDINSGPKYAGERIGKDGAEWILEEKSPRGYHVDHSWSPVEGERFRECCEFLLELSGLKIKKEEIY